MGWNINCPNFLRICIPQVRFSWEKEGFPSDGEAFKLFSDKNKIKKIKIIIKKRKIEKFYPKIIIKFLDKSTFLLFFFLKNIEKGFKAQKLLPWYESQEVV